MPLSPNTTRTGLFTTAPSAGLRISHSAPFGDGVRFAASPRSGTSSIDRTSSLRMDFPPRLDCWKDPRDDCRTGSSVVATRGRCNPDGLHRDAGVDHGEQEGDQQAGAVGAREQYELENGQGAALAEDAAQGLVEVDR